MQINFSTISENLAHTFGDNECLVNYERNRRYSFRQFHLLTNRIVNMMTEKLNLTRNDICYTILDNDNSALMGMFTACKCEAILCYSNIVDSLEDHIGKLDGVKPKVAFVENRILADIMPTLRERGITAISMDTPPAEFPDVLDFWALLEGVSDSNPNVIKDDREDTVLLRFTGGTTGKPKAVMYSIDNLLAMRDAHLALPDAVTHQKTRALHFALISHASGMIFLPVLFKGGATLTMNDRNPQTFFKIIREERVTSTLLVPYMLYKMLEIPGIEQVDFSSLEVIYYGGSTMMSSKLQELQSLFGNIFVQMYAASENAAVAVSMSMADHLPLTDGSQCHLGSAGKIVPGAEMQLRDACGNPVPIGQDGEIWLKSRATSRGYWQNPKKTAEEFCEGYWKSGDAGRLDANGFLYVLDRLKDTFVCNRQRVYPTQLEGVLCSHPQIALAAVVGIPSGGDEEDVHVEIRTYSGEALSQEEISEFLAGKIAAGHHPKSINFTDHIPVSPVGKVLRGQIRDNCLQRRT